jgi:hypothetical protein
MLNVELQELNEKITQLCAYTATRRFYDLPEKEKSLIWQQRLRMKQYARLLEERLENE